MRLVRLQFSLNTLMLGVALAAILLALAVSIYREQGAQAPATQVTSLAFSNNGHLAAAGYEDGTARLWDVASGREVALLAAHSARITAVAFSPDDRAWVTGADDGEVKVWDAGHARPTATFRVGPPIKAIHFAPNGETLAVLNTQRQVELWALDGLSRRLKTEAAYAAFSPDGRRLAIWLFALSKGSPPQDRRYTMVFDTTSGAPVAEKEDGFAWFAPMLPNGKWWINAGGGWLSGSRVYLSYLGDSRFLGWHRREEGFSVITSLAIAPTGSLLATGAWDGTIKLWDLELATHSPKRDRRDTSDLGALGLLETATGTVTSLGFSSDGSLLAAGGFGGVELWDPSSQTIVQRLPETRSIPWLGFGVAFGIWVVLSVASCVRRRAPQNRRQPADEACDEGRRTTKARSARARLSRAAALIMVVLIVSCVCWFLALYSRARRQRSAAMALAKRGVLVCYDYQFSAAGFSPYGQPPEPSLLLRWLGRDFFHRVVEVSCSRPRPIGFREGSGSLEDGDIAVLKDLTGLQELDLQKTPVTDAGLAHLATLHSLSRLILSETDITDAGLRHLEGLKRLTFLDLNDTKVTSGAVERLRQCLPKATINFRTVKETEWDQRRRNEERQRPSL